MNFRVVPPRRSRVERDGLLHHITLLAASEVRQVCRRLAITSSQLLDRASKEVDVKEWVDVGVGKATQEDAHVCVCLLPSETIDFWTGRI